MEKSAGIKKAQDDSLSLDQDDHSVDGREVKKGAAVEKSEKDDGVKIEGTPGNQKRERSSSSATSKAPSRSTRSSNNPEFVAKQRHFLQKVNQGVFYQSSEEESDYSATNGQNHAAKRKRSVSGGLAHSEVGAVVKSTSSVDSGAGSNSGHSSSPVSALKGSSAVKKRKYDVDELSRDIYCWVCHREMGTSSGGSTLSCAVCPRVYHARCCHSIDPGSPHPSSPSSSSNNINASVPTKKGWACPECVKIVRAETMGTRSRAMQLITMDHLCTLLKFVLTRVRAVTGAEPFYGAVDLQQFPRYREFVANPMDLGLIDRNIRRRTYGSTEAFFADMKWLVHNSIIFNTQHSKLTSIARSMLKICRQELMEIENCPDCYSNAHTRKDNWFIDVCRRPHILVWAKLKGFPHWPAKAMRVNKESCVDVRFFGAHDRAWVPARDCFLYSREMPAPPKNRKKNNFDGCIMEVEEHIKKLKEKFGVFVYAPLRTVYDPLQDEEILIKMLPKYQPINLDSPNSDMRENLQEDQISRESPSMSTGTEEDSDRDQSIEEEQSSQKRDYDTTLEDSSEIPGGAYADQPKESIPSTTKPLEDVDKTPVEPVETASEHKGSKNETAAMEIKSDGEANETENEIEKENGSETEDNRKEKGSETVDKEEAKGVESDGDLKEAENEIKMEEKKEEVEEVVLAKGDEGGAEEDGGMGKAKRGESEEGGKGVEVSVGETGEELGKEKEEQALKGRDRPQDDMLEASSAVGEEKEMLDGEIMDRRVVSEAKERTEEIDKDKDESGDKRAEVDVNINDMSGKVESDVGESEVRVYDSLDHANAEEKTEKKEPEERTTDIDSVMKGPSELMGKEKEASRNESSSGEEKEENAKSASEEAGYPTVSVIDESLAEVGGKELLEKHAASTEESKENPQKEEQEKSDLNECGNSKSAIDKLNAVIDHKMEPEIQKCLKSPGSEDEVTVITPVSSMEKQTLCGKKLSRNSCDTAENDALDRDGEESRDKLFQSLRLVNVETIHKQDMNETMMKNSNVEVEKSKRDCSKMGTQVEVSNKIDVNKLRESLMTKCANSSVTGGDLSHASESTSPKNLSLPSMSTTEARNLESSDADLAIKGVDENMDEDSADMANDQPANSSVTVTSPASNKGDVGSQLRVLGKLQQRLSFIKETTSESEESVQEKEDENTVEDADSVMGDASGMSNSDDEEPTAPNDNSLEAEKEGAPEVKCTDKGDDLTSDVKGDQGSDDDVKELTSGKVNVDQCLDDIGGNSESMCVSETKRDEENILHRKGKNDEKEQVDAGEVSKVEKCSSDDGTTVLDNEPEKPTKLAECAEKEGQSVLEKTSSPWNGKASEVADSGRASPMTSQRKKHLEDKVKARASPLIAKPEEVIEEEVLNREVLKESNMVVVQKTVKTRRLDDESSGGSAPKRARKGMAQKALVMERSESPAQDEVFPSMFLDPSVTITVLQEAEKENGGNKEQSSSSSGVEELRTSVNLSNDVSLTMVRGTGALEGLAAMQDGAVSRSSELQEVDLLSQNTQNSSVAPQFRPRARKSFPRPSPRVYARSPQTPTQSPNMEVRRLSASSRGDVSPVNLAAGSSVLKTVAAPGNSVASVPAVAVRGVSATPLAPFVPVNSYPSSTFSTPSTSQGLVRTVVSPVMPSSLLVSNSLSNCASPRLPNLCPRPATYPLSGHQSLFTPSEAGPVSAEFNKHAHKLSCYMRQAIEDILGDLTKMGNTEATIKSLRLEVEKLRWEHAQEIAELKHNHDLVVSEIKTSLEKEKMRLVNDVRRQCETEKLRAIEETKRKQWCANCSKEALFYCCWNTSYCDYPCQQTHWPRHMASCAQNNGMPESGSGDSNGGNRKDGSSGGGHRSSAPPPPFHQLQRPGSTPLEAPHPEEEYYDEDSCSPPTPRTGTSGGSYRVKRRRCGVCKGCLVKDNCGNCAPCRNSKTHQVCRMRRCRSLQSDWPSGGSSRTVSPEPGPNSLPIETPPLTHASKPLHQLQEVPASLPLGAPENEQQLEVGDGSQSLVSREAMNVRLLQTSPFGVTSKLRPIPSPPKGRQQDSALDLPLLPMSSNTPGLPPLHIQHNISGLQSNCSGNEQSPVTLKHSPAVPSQMQLKDLSMESRNDENSETCISRQALVPYPMPSKPLQLDPPVIPGPKASRSRKGHPQRSRNHNHPTRNTYLQPPHFIRQHSSHDDKPFNVNIPEMSPMSHESQPPLLQSFPPFLPESFTLQAEKPQGALASSCPPSPYHIPQSRHQDALFTSAPLGSGGGINYSNISITPIPSIGTNGLHKIQSNDGPKLEAGNYCSPVLPRKRNSEGSVLEGHKDASHLEGLSSRVQFSGHQQIQLKHSRHTQKGLVLPDQRSKSSGDEVLGLGNVCPHPSKSNLMYLGSRGHPLNASQNAENLAALPSNFYPPTALAYCGPPGSSSQANHANVSFLKPHYKSTGVPQNLPVIPSKEDRANRNAQNVIPIAQNPVEVGGLATNFPLQSQGTAPQPPVTNLSVTKFDHDIPNNFSNLANSINNLPNFSAAFFNQGGQPGFSPQSTPSSQSNGPLSPPKYFRVSRKSTRKHAEHGQGESSKAHPTPPYNGPPMFKFRPDNPANFCSQINCPHISCSRSHPTIPQHPVSHPSFPESGFLQPSNPFPMNRYPSPSQNGHRPHSQPPPASQQNNNSYRGVRGSCMAILSATSIIMPPPPPQPPNFLYPPPFDVEMMVRQHQLHRHQMASGVNVFSDALRNSSDRARKL